MDSQQKPDMWWWLSVADNAGCIVGFSGGKWLGSSSCGMCLLPMPVTESLHLYSMLWSRRNFRNGMRWIEQVHMHLFYRWQNKGSGTLVIHTKATLWRICRARPRTDSVHGCGPAEAMGFLASGMKVVRILQRDGLLRLTQWELWRWAGL